MTLPLTINETLKRLSSLPIFMQKSFWWRQYSVRYSLLPLTISIPTSWDLCPRCRLGARSVYTIQSCTTLQCHFSVRSHISRVHVYLAVTCHLHFWQNDRDRLRATAVTRGWNAYRNKSRHRKLTLDKKLLLSALGPQTC